MEGVVMDKRFFDAIESNPIICAIKDDNGLELSLQSESNVIFVLYGDVCTISEIVEKVHEAGKIVIVHIDLINGLSGKDVSVDFIKKNTEADGIISTKVNLIKRAKELQLYTVHRIFLIDSMAFENIDKQYSSCKPDFLEVLPGAMPKVIKRICENKNINIIAGGLINDKEDVLAVLSAGAMSVSSSNSNVWFI